MKILFVLFVFVVFVGCSDKAGEKSSENLTEKVIETYPDGSKKSVDYFSKDKPDECVKQEEYYPNGKIRYSLSTKNGKKNGLCKYFFENGKVQTEQNYEMDIKDGLSIVYSENGEKKIEGKYVSDKPHGKWLFYDEKGNLATTVVYEMGKIVSQN
ncbi:MAG: hypothetical protein JXR58_11875 [Bacteroidales bacterium]|nr:hypothetical protein [Bacteroidales bacterium]